MTSLFNTRLYSNVWTLISMTSPFNTPLYSNVWTLSPMTTLLKHFCMFSDLSRHGDYATESARIWQDSGSYQTQGQFWLQDSSLSTVFKSDPRTATAFPNRSAVCPFCERGFGSKRDLGRHLLTHTGEKPHKCDVCLKKFRLSHHLKKHKLIVHSVLSWPEQKVEPHT